MAWVQSLVRELRSHKVCSEAKKKFLGDARLLWLLGVKCHDVCNLLFNVQPQKKKEKKPKGICVHNSDMVRNMVIHVYFSNFHNKELGWIKSLGEFKDSF